LVEACHGGADSPSRSALEAAEPRVVAPAASAGPPATDAVANSVDAPVTPAPWPRAKPPLVETDWCIDSVSALDEETCYVLPSARTDSLLIYLHGIVPPTKDSPQKTKVETVIANAVRRAGIAALIPRGKQGFAPKGRGDWLGWPTKPASYQGCAASLVAAFAEKRKKLEDITGAPFARVYIAGSSSGAYFAAGLALEGGIDVDGFGAMSGGSTFEPNELERLEPKPFYIGYGKYDPHVRGPAMELGELLRRAHWPVRTEEHPVDHGAKEIYLDEAIAFWREQSQEKSSARTVSVAGR
jgi:predicted esterase